MTDIEDAERERLGRLFPVTVLPYNADWPRLYQEEAGFLKERFPDVIIRTEHYGSTAVPGLAAKDCIDILAEILSFDCAEKKIMPVLNECSAYGHDWYEDHLVFFKGYFAEGAQRYHIHMAPAGHRLWEGLLFRDYLRQHPETTKEYERLKYQLAELHRFDREAYTEAKTAFIREITERAKS